MNVDIGCLVGDCDCKGEVEEILVIGLDLVVGKL